MKLGSLKSWYGLARIGVHHDLEPDEQKKLILTNKIASLIMAICLFASSLAFILQDQSSSAPRLVLLAMTMLVVLGLNYFHQYRSASILLLTLPGVMVGIIPLITGSISEGIFLWTPYFSAGFSILPIFVLNAKKDRYALWLLGAFYLVLTLFIDRWFEWRMDYRLQLDFIHEHYRFYKIPQVELWLFLNVTFYSVIAINRRHEKRLSKLNLELREKNEEIQTQKEEISLQNDELLEKQEEISTINQNLEMILNERTKVIEERNRQIIEYAYFNAHQVRGPLARIMGLVNLTRHHTNPEELLDIVNRMDISAQELNQVVLQINKILEDEGGATQNDDFVSS